MTKKLSLVLAVLVMAGLSCRRQVATTPAMTATTTPAMTNTPVMAESPTPTLTEIPTCVTAMVALHLRSGSSVDSEIVTWLLHGVRVNVLVRSGTWSYVETEAGLKGWVNSQYIGQCP